MYVDYRENYRYSRAQSPMERVRTPYRHPALGELNAYEIKLVQALRDREEKQAKKAIATPEDMLDLLQSQVSSKAQPSVEHVPLAPAIPAVVKETLKQTEVKASPMPSPVLEVPIPITPYQRIITMSLLTPCTGEDTSTDHSQGACSTSS